MNRLQSVIDYTTGTTPTPKSETEEHVTRGSMETYVNSTNTSQPLGPSSLWTKFQNTFAEAIKRKEEIEYSSHTSSTPFPENLPAIVNLKRRLERVNMDYQSFTGNSRTSIFDLNDLPYISQMRSLLLIVCASTFVIAPIAYMPLGTIQAAYDQKCFLYTKIRLTQWTTMYNQTIGRRIVAFDSVSTEWGQTSICDFTTFIPVSMSIFSIIIGMSTFTIWPTMMSLGRGGALMMTYAFLTLFCMIACIVSVGFLHDGYRFTCDKLREADGRFSCLSLNNMEIYIKELRSSRMVRNINRAMVAAQIIGWCLVGLMLSKILICVLTFLIIWFYLNSR